MDGFDAESDMQVAVRSEDDDGPQRCVAADESVDIVGVEVKSSMATVVESTSWTAESNTDVAFVHLVSSHYCNVTRSRRIRHAFMHWKHCCSFPPHGGDEAQTDYVFF